jgi:uncharacterized protein (UPF0335 family)
MEQINAETKKQLEDIINSIEVAESEKEKAQEMVKEIYESAESKGFDTKALKKIVKMRKIPEDKRKYEEGIIDTYMAALGMR